MSTPSNALNISATGIVKFDPVNLFTAVTLTAHDVLIGASGNSITSVSPSTAGLVLTSNGVSADPTFQSVSGFISTLAADDASAVSGSVITISGGTTGLTTTASAATVRLTGILKLSNGGTGANLTASNGGIFYSNATTGAILSGTATAGQLLQSGSNAAPTWTTSTYPSTNAINTLLYASSANVMAALATGNNGVLITGTGGIPSILANGTTGQVLTATTGSPPSWASTSAGTVSSVSGTANQVAVANGTTNAVISLIGPYTPATYTAHGVLVGEGTSSIVALAAGTAGQVLQSGGASADPTYSTATYPSTAGTSGNVLVSNGTNFVSSALSTGGFVWNDTTGTSATLAKGNGYAADNSGLVTYTLPSVASSTFGDTIKIMGYNSGGWKIVYTTNQQIIGGVASTAVTTGNLASTNRYDQLTIRCSPNTNLWIVEQSFGTLAYT
jgi:hypothetical protein